MLHDMSFKTTFMSKVVLEYSVEQISQVLLDATNLPSWNPALTHVGPGDAQGKHPVRVQRLLAGTLTLRAAEGQIDFVIAVPGIVEQSAFVLSARGSRTEVTHSVTQTGMLARAIGESEAALVPRRRLARLHQVLSETFPAAVYKEEGRIDSN